MKNTTKLKNTGSLFNWLMGNNETTPVVGKGATIMYWTDRSAYEVLEVNEVKKSCVIQKYNAKRIDGLGMSDSQKYEYKELYGPKITLVYRWGSWKKVGSQINWIPEMLEKYEKNTVLLQETYKTAGGKYEECRISTVIEGMTKLHKTYNPVNIIFGVKEEYFDYSF